jgi:hypothetical protein
VAKLFIRFLPVGDCKGREAAFCASVLFVLGLLPVAPATPTPVCAFVSAGHRVRGLGEIGAKSAVESCESGYLTGKVLSNDFRRAIERVAPHASPVELTSRPEGAQKNGNPRGVQMEAKSSSGIRGWTIYRVHSGAEGGKTIESRHSMEFAIVPIAGDRPLFGKAIFVKSDEQGRFEIALAPGKYWIGPKKKALDPTGFVPGPIMFSERVMVISEGAFTDVEIFGESYAP